MAIAVLLVGLRVDNLLHAVPSSLSGAIHIASPTDKYKGGF